LDVCAGKKDLRQRVFAVPPLPLRIPLIAPNVPSS
jgi:hypothetical protein